MGNTTFSNDKREGYINSVNINHSLYDSIVYNFYLKLFVFDTDVDMVDISSDCIFKVF